MIVRKFLAWAREAPAGERAQALRVLAQGWLHSSMPAQMRREAEAALTAALDDPSAQVRRALAEVFAAAPDAPRHIVIALANDQSDVACHVLASSPLLSHEDLVDCATIGDALAQAAIAGRPSLSAHVCVTLAERGCRDALVVLARNHGADIPDHSILKMIERHGDDGELREALAGRDYLPGTVHSDLVRAAASSLTDFVTECGWLSRDRAERVARESTDRATTRIVQDVLQDDPLDGAIELVRHLRQRGALSVALLLRLLLSGDRTFFITALADLSGLSLERVAGFVRVHGGGGFAALYARAKMPADLFAAFVAALQAQDEYLLEAGSGELRLSRSLVAFVLAQCERSSTPPQAMALLRRFEAEAAQNEARVLTRAYASQPLPQAPPEPEPSRTAVETGPLDLASIRRQLAQMAAE